MYAIEDLCYDVVIGRDFLTEHSCIIDFHNKSLRFLQGETVIAPEFPGSSEHMAAANETVQEASRSTGSNNVVNVPTSECKVTRKAHVTSSMDQHETEIENEAKTTDASRSKRKRERRRRAKLLKDAQREMEDMHTRQINEVSKDNEDYEVTKDATAYEAYTKDTGKSSTEDSREVKYIQEKEEFDKRNTEDIDTEVIKEDEDMSQNILLKSFQVKHKLQEDTQEVTEDIDVQRSIKQEAAANIQQELPHNASKKKKEIDTKHK